MCAFCIVIVSAESWSMYIADGCYSATSTAMLPKVVNRMLVRHSALATLLIGATILSRKVSGQANE